MTVVNFTKKQNVLTGGSVIIGEAKLTDSRAMGLWTDGHNFEKRIFQTCVRACVRPSRRP